MIKVYKTFELTEDDWKQIVDGFNDSFGSNNSIKDMKAYYVNNELGYSYHAIDVTDEGILRGYNSIVPTKYYYNGSEIIAGISGGTYVIKEFRKDVFIFKHLMEALFESCCADGMIMKVGVPNNNSFKYAIKINKAKLVGYLNYYILPIHAFRLVTAKRHGFLNAVSAFFAKFHLFNVSLISSVYNLKASQKTFELVSDNHFYDTRYRKRKYYTECSKGDYTGFYRVTEEDGKKVVYLMEFREKGKRTLKALAFVTKYVMKSEKDIDAIMFVGTMNMKQPLLIKVPKKFEPKPLPLTINIINGDKEFEAIALDSKSWDFSLQNFDAR